MSNNIFLKHSAAEQDDACLASIEPTHSARLEQSHYTGNTLAMYLTLPSPQGHGLVCPQVLFEQD